MIGFENCAGAWKQEIRSTKRPRQKRTWTFLGDEEIKLGDVEAPPKLISLLKVLRYHFFDTINEY